MLGVQHEDILHPAQHHDPLEGTADIVRYPQIVGALNVGGVLCRRNDDDRDLVQPCVVLHHPQHIKAVHAGHHQVQQQQRDIRALPHQLHCRCAVLCFQVVIAIAQYLLEQGTVDLGIIRDQDLRFLVHGHVSPFAVHPSAPALFRVRCLHCPDAAGFPRHPLYCVHLYFTGFYSKMQGCVQHFCHFPVFSASVLIPGCINAIQSVLKPISGERAILENPQIFQNCKLKTVFPLMMARAQRRPF